MAKLDYRPGDPIIVNGYRRTVSQVTTFPDFADVYLTADPVDGSRSIRLTAAEPEWRRPVSSGPVLARKYSIGDRFECDGHRWTLVDFADDFLHRGDGTIVARFERDGGGFTYMTCDEHLVGIDTGDE